MYYNQDNEMTNFVIGDNTFNSGESQELIDAKSFIGYKKSVLINNEGEDGDTSNIEDGGLIKAEEKIEKYKNGKNIKTHSYFYKIEDEENLTSEATNEYLVLCQYLAQNKMRSSVS